MKSMQRKIETRAVSEVKRIIARHPTMEDYIEVQNTGACFDGHIRIYLDDNSAKDKSNIDYDIPVQIKGHEDKSSDYLKAETINFSVSLDDLRAYYRGNGCMYFVVVMTEGGGSYRVFYNSLYPSKVFTYLEEAKLKGNLKSCTISFALLPEKIEEMALVMKQFAYEVRKQGSGYGQIVQDAIRIEELGQIKNLTVTTMGRDLLLCIKSGDAVFYGKKNHEKIEYPILPKLNSASIEKRVDKPVSVANKEYYSSFHFKKTVFPYGNKKYQEDVVLIKLSDNLSFTWHESDNKFQVNPISTIDAFITDAEFLIALSKGGSLAIDGHPIINGITLNNESIKWLQWYIDVGNALRKIKCKIDTTIPHLTDEQIRQLNCLRGYCKWKMNDSTLSLSVYDWEFGDKYYPILVKRDPVNGTIDVDEFIFDLKHHCCLRGEKDSSAKTDYSAIVPNFYNRTPKVLANLVYYDYESMAEQIRRSQINDISEDTMNDLGLRLISAFDISDNRKLLELASIVFSRLYALRNSCVYLINSLQVAIRLNGDLDYDQRRELTSITKEKTDLSDSEFSVFCFCRAVLLNDSFSHKIYESLSAEDKEMISEMPIMHLFS